MERSVPRPGLIITILVLIVAAFVLPRLFKPPKFQENRVLAAAPTLTAAGGLGAFRKQADAYVADRFPPRPFLIGYLNFIRMKAGDSGAERVLVGRDGWLFYDDLTGLSAARGIGAIEDVQAADWLRGLAGRTEALGGRPYLVVVPPTKEIVYPEMGPAWYPGPSPHRTSLRLVELAARTQPGSILYLLDDVAALKARGGPAFSRHDTHWTGDAAYAGYVRIMSRLRALGFDQPTRPLSDFRYGQKGVPLPRDLALMLAVASFVDVSYREYFDPRAPAMTTTWLSERRGWPAPHVVDTGQAGKPTLLLTRDSFSNALTPFLMGHFSRVILTHIDDGVFRKDLIDRFQPDIVMLEVQEHGLGASMDGALPVSEAAEARIEAALAEAPGAGSPAVSSIVRGRFKTLVTAGAAFAGLDAAAPTTLCNVEEARLDARSMVVSGWISDLSSQPRSTDAAVRLSGASGDYVHPLVTYQPRPDVAAFFKRVIASPSGFKASLSIVGLPQGTYGVRVYRRAPVGWIVCQGPQTLVRP